MVEICTFAACKENSTNKRTFYPSSPLVLIIINYDEHPDDPRLDPLIRRVPFPFRAGLNLSRGWPLPSYF
jgi:hypothetical protein